MYMKLKYVFGSLLVSLFLGCSHPLTSFRYTCDMFGNNSIKYMVTYHHGYMVTIRQKRYLLVHYDTLHRCWLKPTESVSFKEDSLFLNEESRDSLACELQFLTSVGKNKKFVKATDSPDIRLQMDGRVYKLTYSNDSHRRIINFMNHHSAIPIK